MKVIFLDVDGVLSCFGERGLCGQRLDILADVVKRTGAELVLSSMWRHPHCRDQRMRLQAELLRRGIALFSMTPLLSGEDRGDEIQSWLRGYQHSQPIEYFVILDDDPNDEMGALKPHMIRCDGFTGLTPAIAEKIVETLTAPAQA